MATCHWQGMLKYYSIKDKYILYFVYQLLLKYVINGLYMLLMD